MTKITKEQKRKNSEGEKESGSIITQKHDRNIIKWNARKESDSHHPSRTSYLRQLGFVGTTTQGAIQWIRHLLLLSLYSLYIYIYTFQNFFSLRFQDVAIAFFHALQTSRTRFSLPNDKFQRNVTIVQIVVRYLLATLYTRVSAGVGAE